MFINIITTGYIKETKQFAPMVFSISNSRLAPCARMKRSAVCHSAMLYSGSSATKLQARKAGIRNAMTPAPLNVNCQRISAALSLCPRRIEQLLIN